MQVRYREVLDNHDQTEVTSESKKNFREEKTMQRLVFTIMLVTCLTLSALGQKDKGSQKPVVDQTQPQMEQRAAAAKQRSGKSVDPNKIGTPVADPKRRRHVVCRTLGPEEWGLVFPDIPGEYGGTVCVRK